MKNEKLFKRMKNECCLRTHHWPCWALLDASSHLYIQVCPSVGLSVGRSAGQAFVKDGKIDDFEHEINKSSTCALLKSADIAVLPRTG